jgi:hypothetical protein
MCIKNKTAYSLQGDFYSTEFKFLEIKVLKCNPKTSKVTCKNVTEIDDYFNPKYFSFAFVNSYFDFRDYEKPIKQFIDDSLFF